MENEANIKRLQPIGTNRNKGLTFDKSSFGWREGVIGDERGDVLWERVREVYESIEIKKQRIYKID